MGSTGRGKHKRGNRKTPSSKAYHDHNHDAKLYTNDEVGGEELVSNHDCCNNNDWRGYHTEEELMSNLLLNLNSMYNEAIRRLCELGYERIVVSKAILTNGHCYGANHVLTNIMHNTLRYLRTGMSDRNIPNFDSMTQLQKISVGALIYVLLKDKPHMSKREAMRFLLEKDLHICNATLMKIPRPQSQSSDYNVGNGEFPKNDYPLDAIEMTFRREIDFLESFNLTSSMKDLLRRDVAAFAAEFMANSKVFQTLTGCNNASLVNSNSSTGFNIGSEALVGKNEQLQVAQSQVVGTEMDKFCDLNIDEDILHAPLDEKYEMIIDLLKQVKDLEQQVKERKNWAQQKAMQAARKVCLDRTEIIMLRMEREHTLGLNGKHTLENSAKKKLWYMEQSLSDMENNVRNAYCIADYANANVKQHEFENAELSAELEASRLNASESLRTSVEVEKREKKCLQKLLAWEKQKTKLHEDTVVVKRQILELETQFVRVEAAQEDAEAKWKEAQKAKELALAELEEERHLLKETEATHKRGHEALRQKIESALQRHKDDLQKLELEFSQLKVSTQTSEPEGELIARMFNELDNVEDFCSDRKCINCLTEEVTVVFLPCAHQILCLNCSDSYGKEGRPVCPCCSLLIEQKIQVFRA